MNMILLYMLKSSSEAWASPERTAYYRVVRERYHIDLP